MARWTLENRCVEVPEHVSGRTTLIFGLDFDRGDRVALRRALMNSWQLGQRSV
jgi:hypothetical protein